VKKHTITVLLDEDIRKPEETIQLLKSQRPHWDVQHVARSGLEGQKDPAIFTEAQNRLALLITADKGFGDIRKYPPGSNHGILLLRPSQDSVLGQHAALNTALAHSADHQLQNNLTIADETTVRRVAQQTHFRSEDQPQSENEIGSKSEGSKTFLQPLLHQAKEGHLHLSKDDLNNLNDQDVRTLLDAQELKTLNDIKRGALTKTFHEDSLLSDEISGVRTVKEQLERAPGQEQRFGQSVDSLKTQTPQQEREKNQTKDSTHEH